MRGIYRRRGSMSIAIVLAAFAWCLLDHIALAQEASSTPDIPKQFRNTRFVPSGEVQTIGTTTALYPDCSPRGPIVARVVEKPAHGEVSFESGDVFPTYPQRSPFFACNSKRAPGLMVNYRSEQDFGQDNMKVYLILGIAY